MKNVNQIQEAYALIGVMGQYSGEAKLAIQLEVLHWVLEGDSRFDGLLEIGRKFLADAANGKKAVLVYGTPENGEPPENAPRWEYGAGAKEKADA